MECSGGRGIHLFLSFFLLPFLYFSSHLFFCTLLFCVTMRIDDVVESKNVANVIYEVVEKMVVAEEEEEVVEEVAADPEAAEATDLLMALMRELWRRLAYAYATYVTPIMTTDPSEHVPPSVLWVVFGVAIAAMFYQIWKIVALAKLKRKVL